MNLKPTSCQLGIRVPKEIQKPFTTKAAGQITVIGFLIESSTTSAQVKRDKIQKVLINVF